VSVYALLQDPLGKGGTATVVDWYRAWMDLNRPGEREEYYLDDSAKMTWRDLRGWGPADHRIPRLWPRLHVPQYLAGRRLLRPVLSGPEVHVVGASAVHGALSGKQPARLVWVATTINDERRPEVVSLLSPARRLLYRATLRTLARIERRTLHRADRLLAMSPHTADRLIAEGADSSKVEVVLVPVDTERFAPPDPEAERHGALFVGRVNDRRKGFGRVEDLLGSSDVARVHGVDVVSRATPRETLAGMRWLGYVENLPPVYGAAEVLLLPSLQEGLGIVALEALACGTPVVAFRCGGPDQLLADSGGGIVVEDAAAFREAVEAILEDPERRDRMGVAGRAWVEKHASGAAFLADPTTFAG
jgi:glycosyltransferase involved in cell wall biosynthesis